ncbi:MAG: RNA pseudouridine synthase [Bacteroidetes bacterium]|nr:RNA pseudouridine synthase [Bacteroidota bacterium]
MRSFLSEDILFEDNHLLIVNKQPGQIVQGDKTGDMPLSEQIKLYLKEVYHKPGNVYLGVVHRLDRPVSGAVIFTKTSKALARLNLMLKERRMEKVYWAVVKNRPGKDHDHLVHYLRRNEEKNKAYLADLSAKNAVRAELSYSLIASGDRYHLLEVQLFTGRHHQIRAQLSAIGCPIKGDIKYGFDRTNPDGSIHLHARKIGLDHPVRDEKIEIMANPPDDRLWNLFIKQLS